MTRATFPALILMILLAACAPGRPAVSQSDIETRVALLRTGQATPQATTGGVVVATVQTEIPQLTATATITPTLTPTATMPATDPVTWLGTPTWRDTFSGTTNFYTLSDENIQFTYAPDAFSMTALNINGWRSWSLGGRRIANFYLEATFKVGNCSGGDQYGLVFRAPDPSEGYFYGVSCDGQVSLTRWDTMAYLVSWKPAPSLKSGPNQTNRVGVMAEGSELTLYINGEEVASLTNGRYNEGLFGFHIASNGTFAFNVLVDEVAYWNQ